MKITWELLTILILLLIASVISFAVWQYQETQRNFIANGYQRCPNIGSYGYYWAKECFGARP